MDQEPLPVGWGGGSELPFSEHPHMLGAIFANCTEIQELIEFLTYVREDHLVQHKHNRIAMTHNHFYMWKGERDGKPDLQIWSTSGDWSAGEH